MTKPIFRQNSITCTYVKIFSTSYTCQMWRNIRFLHIGHVEKFQITQHVETFLDFSTSVMWRSLKLLHMWRNFWFVHICHVYKSEIFSTWQIFLHISNLWYLWQISGMCPNRLLNFSRGASLASYLPRPCTAYSSVAHRPCLAGTNHSVDLPIFFSSHVLSWFFLPRTPPSSIGHLVSRFKRSHCIKCCDSLCFLGSSIFCYS